MLAVFTSNIEFQFLNEEQLFEAKVVMVLVRESPFVTLHIYVLKISQKMHSFEDLKSSMPSYREFTPDIASINVTDSTV